MDGYDGDSISENEWYEYEEQELDDVYEYDESESCSDLDEV